MIAINTRPSHVIAIIPNNPNQWIPVRMMATVMFFWYQVSLFSSPRQHDPMPKNTSRQTRISKCSSASNRQEGQHDLTPVPSRPTRIRDNISLSHHWAGQRIPTLEQETDKNHVACRRSSKWLCRAYFNWDPPLGTAKENDAGHAVPDGLLPQSLRWEADVVIRQSCTRRNS